MNRIKNKKKNSGYGGLMLDVSEVFVRRNAIQAKTRFDCDGEDVN